jgi:hypothetical protein
MPNPYGLPEFTAPTSQAGAASGAVQWAKATGSKRARPNPNAKSWEDYSAVPQGPMSAAMQGKIDKEGWTRDPVKGWGKQQADGSWGLSARGAPAGPGAVPTAAAGAAVAPGLQAPGFAGVMPLSGSRPAAPGAPPTGFGKVRPMTRGGHGSGGYYEPNAMR